MVVLAGLVAVKFGGILGGPDPIAAMFGWRGDDILAIRLGRRSADIPDC